ncbi:ketoacyl-ACP synthase III family protein [Streptomyces albipurpureus]|uniref:Ketoacyl-ACP synthase III family protein n=1 Tax=Streptomyces albipurpureus TaxID=2897419 RepID=A0ABT0UTK9_9ACTN|nr:ketoacyl-ACP synthase III family protein [Streptomyces sp. CWNU-1]MCM2391784.1 ketoacyl-ACP synthase III family protein [Streptomyces sp. CWNU-1]
MRWDSVFVAGTGAWLPEPFPAHAAVEAGEYDPEQFEADGLLSVRVADDDVAPPDMAVQAATTALKRSGLDPETVRLLLHNYVWFQGQTMWPVASYIADHAVHWGVPAFEVKQECNAAVSSLELAARHLSTEPEAAAAVLTTADRFAEPLIHRWSAEAGLVYADGGTALVLSNRAGFARVLSTATRADNRMEAVARGAGLTPLPTDEPYDHAARFAHYLRAQGNMREASERLIAMVIGAVDDALTDADTERGDIAWAVIPTGGRSKMQWQAEQLLGVPAERTTWEFGRRTGHLGAGDQFAALNDLAERGELKPGDKVLMLSAGPGTASCAVLEITAAPLWAAPAPLAHEPEPQS